MKQILQNLKTGDTEVVEVPAPVAGRGQLLIRTRKSLVSAGTERMLVQFGKAGWIEKARQQPEKVRMVLDKIRTDGLSATLNAVLGKLDQPLAMGYCNVGEVIALGPDVQGFEVGDRVASNGKHAEIVAVPVNLCAKVPDDVPDEEAAFTVVSAIALQGIRLANPTLGEMVVVTGLGLIGLITVQLLRAAGCNVLGLDLDPAKLELARAMGATVLDVTSGADVVAFAQKFSRGRGVDAVVVTASTESSEPIHQAALMCRKRGRIVLVGVTGLDLSRNDFYEKELTFQVSCSYGPGRYDPAYEEKGQDYPVAFVRWTEQRNFEAALDMMSGRRLDVRPLISHEFTIEAAPKAYALISGTEFSLGVLLDYGLASISKPLLRSVQVSAPKASTRQSLSFIGSGNYATQVLLPSFVASGAQLRAIASNGGVSSVHAARKFGIERATTDVASIFTDTDTDAVVIATRHDSHSHLVLQALASGKHVFVEKPLCLSLDELERIRMAAEAGHSMVMVGFNRRFAPQVRRIRDLLATAQGPKSFVMTVNAGAIPANHWTQDPAVGGGRLVGEGCHFIDLLRHLAGSPLVSHSVVAMDTKIRDSAAITLRFADGSIGTIHYLANGHKSFPKERLEVFVDGRILQLDNFRSLRGFGWPGFSSMKLWKQDKGQNDCSLAFVQALGRGGPSPIPLEEIIEVSRVSIEIQHAATG